MSQGTEVNCHVPIRIRLIGRPDPETLHRAVATAVRQRLREAAAHMAVEAGYAVTFDWQGIPLGQHTVAAIESTVASAVDEMVTEVTRAGQARDTGLPSEPVDPERDLAPLDGYLIPSYAGGGRKKGIPAKRQYHPEPDLSGDGLVEAIGRENPNWTAAQRDIALLGALETAGYHVRDGEAVGVMFSDATGGYVIYPVLFESRYPLKTQWGISTRIPKLLGFKVNEDGQLNKVPFKISVTSTVWARGLGDTSTAQARAAIRVTRFTEKARDALAAARSRIVREQGQAAYAELERATLQRIADEPEEAGVAGYLDLVVDDEPLLLAMDTPVTMTADELLPIVIYRQIVRVPEPSGGPGSATTDGGSAPGGSPYPASEDIQELVCEPFEGEPPLSELGADGERLRSLIAEIAGQLSIKVCEYAGNFAINAVSAFGGRASVSNTLDLLRRVAGVAPLLSELRRMIEEVYERIRLHGNPSSWILHFGAEFWPSARHSVATLFGTTCKVLLLDLLDRSAEQIRARKDKLDAYADLFEKVLLPRLHHNGDLRKLRDRLRAGQAPPMGMVPYTERIPDSSGSAGSYPAYRSWEEAIKGMPDALAPTTQQQGQPLPPWGFLVQAAEGLRISDGTRSWSVKELEHEIVTGRALLESIDPFIKQLLDLEDVLERFDDPRRGVRATLESLLDEMLEKNADQREKTVGTPDFVFEVPGMRRMEFRGEPAWVYAFRLAKIVDDPSAPTIPGTEYQLTGIHALAHQAIKTSFGDSDLYAEGLEYLFDAEQGRTKFWAVLELPGLVLLSVVCPPLGAAVGILVAGYHLHEAGERKEAYQSLLEPEKILNYAEIEAELFAARLGLALSIIPEAGTILRGGARFGGKLVTEGIGAAVADTGKAVAGGIAKQTIAALEKNLTVEFVKHMLTAEVVQRISELALEPIVTQIEREAAVLGPVGGSASLLRVLQQIDREP